LAIENTNYLIFPTDSKKMMWDFYILFLLVWTATILPFTIAFTDYDEYPILIPLDFFLDLSFMIDIALTFFTAVKNNETGRYEYRRNVIAINYCRSWFFIDVISTIPWSVIEWTGDVAVEDEERSIKMMRILRLNKFYKFFRLLRLMKLIRILKYLRIGLGKAS
jgi:hyperpolarization activated cyclic nucleotide-gated potassium channel 2